MEEPELEVKVTIYNINVGQNKKLMKKSKVLREYMIFVEKVRGYVADEKDLEKAIEEAINECIQEHVLEDFLRKRRNEVMKVITLDYTWERREELIREEEREEGRAEGREEGRAEGREEGRAEGREEERAKLIIRMLANGMTPEQISSFTGIPIEEVESAQKSMSEKE